MFALSGIPLWMFHHEGFGLHVCALLVVGPCSRMSPTSLAGNIVAYVTSITIP